MTKRCERLTEITILNFNDMRCTAQQEQCPKNRLKCRIGQSCWQVRK